MKGEIRTEVFWPVVAGFEMEVEYQLKCVDAWPDRDDEPAGEVWTYVEESAVSTATQLNFSELDRLAEQHAKQRGFI